MPLKDGQPLAELYTVKKDELVPASTRGLYLAESFARQDGWVVTDERVRWKDWVKQQGLVENKPVRASHLQRFGDKALALLERRGVVAYINGRIDAKQFAAELAKEWAGLPRILGDAPEKSYYAGDGLNAALVGVDEVLRVVGVIAAR
jgi:hypothetical protein